MIAHIGEEMFDRAEQEGAETPALLLDGVESLPREEAGEELVRQFARRVFLPAFPLKEREYRRGVGGAQITPGGFRLRGITACLQHLRPLGGDESGRRVRGMAGILGGQITFLPMP